ncbi:flagellar basal-body MS-ring/collar protein FliF [Bacillota bacterium Lsc_1132]
MKETINTYVNKLKSFWSSRSKKQKKIYLVSALSLAVLIGIASFFATRTTLVPLYSNLSPSETGTIKQSLDAKGVKSEIADGGTTIKVPSDVVDSLKVQLAAEGLPKSGSIDYSFFSQKASLGTTDNEFNVIKLDAMQTELANLIKGIQGVQDAKVMINLPDKGIFVSDKGEQASASIVLTTKPGYQFRDDQIKGLYQLVSKSVPNLPTDNIVIMNQYFEYYDLNNQQNSTGSGSTFANQSEIKKQIERDIQRQVQTMLGTLMGQDKVVVSVSADIDFTQEKREENLVEPVDKKNMKGIAISAQNIKETFTGNGIPAGGTPQSQTATGSLGSSYQAGSNSIGDYQKTDDKVNYEVNRIRRQIVESPYKIRDLGIQVMVEPPKPNDPKSLPQSRVNDISNILGTIVRTTIDKSSTGKPLTNQDLKNRIVVSVQPFNGKMNVAQQPQTAIPWWIYLVGGVLLAAIILLLILFLRARNKRNEEEEVAINQLEPVYVPDVNKEQETESTLRQKQLEKMAKEHPEDFAKLLRSWIAED